MTSMMIFMDPPTHTRYRKLVSRAFTPRHMSALEPRIRALASKFLDEFTGAGTFDYVADFGARLPVMVISALLGAPEEDEAQLREWTDATLHIDPGEMMGAHASEYPPGHTRLLAGAHRRSPAQTARRHHERTHDRANSTRKTARRGTSPTTRSTPSWG